MKQTISDVIVVTVLMITMIHTATGTPTVRNMFDSSVDNTGVTIVTDAVMTELKEQLPPIHVINTHTTKLYLAYMAERKHTHTCFMLSVANCKRYLHTSGSEADGLCPLRRCCAHCRIER